MIRGCDRDPTAPGLARRRGVVRACEGAHDAAVDPALALDLAVKAAVVLFALIPIVRPDASHFAGKAMGVRAVLYPAMLLPIPVAWMLSGLPGPYPVWADIAFGLPFLIDAGANVFGLFAIEHFDVIPHFLGWFFLSLVFGLAIAPLAGERWVVFGLVVGFGAVIDILWEAGEFTMMKSGASGLQLTYENTIQDLLVSLTGATVAAIAMATVLWPTEGTPATLFGWIN
jgi:hypothetical protein